MEMVEPLSRPPPGSFFSSFISISFSKYESNGASDTKQENMAPKMLILFK